MNADEGRFAGSPSDDHETFAVIGAAIEVHREIGPGFLEAVYQEALAAELTDRKVPWQREVEVPVFYKGRTLKCSYRADFVCYGSVIVELKAISEVTAREHAQVLNYLKATRMRRALLFNFGANRLEFKRFVYSPSDPRSSVSSAVDSSSSD
ncbi:MAG: GxxExxY protein [Isosphaeraceae bacterium]